MTGSRSSANGGIAPDLIGFGRSGKAGNLDYSVGGISDFLARLMAELDVDRVRLVVHDWGAAIGLAFAQRSPERVERIVIIDGVPMFPADGVHWHLAARMWERPLIGELVMGAITKWLLARTLRDGGTRPDAWKSERIDTIWEQFDQGHPTRDPRLTRSATMDELATAGSGLATLGAPALVLWGEQDPWLDPGIGATYAEVLPVATLERIPDAGRWPWIGPSCGHRPRGGVPGRASTRNRVRLPGRSPIPSARTSRPNSAAARGDRTAAAPRSPRVGDGLAGPGRVVRRQELPRARRRNASAWPSAWMCE